ncbi:MAG: murein L,D-transpeptidase [Candidatus Binatia bacterium]
MRRTGPSGTAPALARRLAGLAILAVLAGSAQARGHAADDTAAVIQAIVEAGRHPWLRLPEFALDHPQVQTLYAARAFAPLWVEGREPTANAYSAIAALGAAAARGLSPADYDAAPLAAAAQRLASGEQDSEAVGEFDAALTIATTRYAAHAFGGRIQPRAVHRAYDMGPKALDLPNFVRELAASAEPDGPRRLLTALDPPFPEFAGLTAALARYRELACDGVPEVPALPKLRPLDTHAGVPALRARLAALGDLPAHTGTPATSSLYDTTLVSAVRRFQRRHGLAPDGVIGQATLAALRAPLAERVGQIELAMERLRWLPSSWPRRFIFVNIPEFRLRGFETGASGPPLSMNIVVGDSASAQKYRTPVLQADMTHVIFRPYWLVPPRIAREELFPAIESDPNYLARHHMEVVDGRIRQLPGRNNSLGLVKFIFPNPYHVYLHDTPKKALFARARRDFSHGCIRVADPVALASFVLTDTPGWDRNRIEQAMREGRDNRRVDLATPVPVYLFYTTVIIDQDGEANFFSDIYGHDATLRRQLGEDAVNGRAIR